METKKFEVGQLWRDGYGTLRKITEITDESDYPIKTLHDSEGYYTFTMQGHHIAGDEESVLNLVALVANADGTPAQLEANPGVTDLHVCDPTRAEFIDRITHDLFFKAMSEGFGEATADSWVRAAVKVRDDLVRG